MLSACVLVFDSSWDDHLPLVEFSYNNNLQSSINMVPYEALNGTPSRSPLYWVEASESTVVRQMTNYDTGKIILLGPKLIAETTEQIVLIRQRLQEAQNR